jgi:poly(3-hydroxybutyrate) depolymerase
MRFAEILETLGRSPVLERQPEVENRGHISTRRYANAAGRRNYKLYIPSGYQNEPLPLVVMLHGCTQNADDFAAGTQMNSLAETHNCIVVSPIQPKDASNWIGLTYRPLYRLHLRHAEGNFRVIRACPGELSQRYSLALGR